MVAQTETSHKRVVIPRWLAFLLIAALALSITAGILSIVLSDDEPTPQYPYDTELSLLVYDLTTWLPRIDWYTEAILSNDRRELDSPTLVALAHKYQEDIAEIKQDYDRLPEPPAELAADHEALGNSISLFVEFADELAVAAEAAHAGNQNGAITHLTSAQHLFEDAGDAFSSLD